MCFALGRILTRLKRLPLIFFVPIKDSGCEKLAIAGGDAVICWWYCWSSPDVGCWMWEGGESRRVQGIYDRCLPASSDSISWAA